MYKTLRLSVLSRILDDSALLRTAGNTGVVTLRSYAGTKDENDASPQSMQIVPFSDFLKERQTEAKRSLLFDVNSETNCDQLISLCEKYGNIRKFFFSELVQGRYVALIEMEDIGPTRELFASFSFRANKRSPRMFSPFVSADFSCLITTPTNFTRSNIVRQTLRDSERECYLWDTKGGSNKGFWLLYNEEKINEFSLRLRFLVTLQMQTVLGSLWNNIDMYPFGGSANGFGNRNSDLDLTMIFKNYSKRSFVNYKTKEIDQDFEAHNKYFDAVATILRDFVPGCAFVTPISRAKVPIVKFYQQYVELECDLSINCMSGVLLTELLYVTGFLNNLVKPLAFVVKKWASQVKLTRTSPPGKRITNFGLLAMVVFFLQQKQHGVKGYLPPFNVFPLDWDGWMLTRRQYQTLNNKLSKMDLQWEVDEKLDVLVYNFFNFYSKFNYKLFGISIRTGKVLPNKNNVPFLIENPLDTSLNIAKQVDESELEKIKSYCRIAKELYEQKETFTKDFFREEMYHVDKSNSQSVKNKSVSI